MSTLAKARSNSRLRLRGCVNAELQPLSPKYTSLRKRLWAKSNSVHTCEESFGEPENIMKKEKTSKTQQQADDEMRSEYDFRDGCVANTVKPIGAGIR